MTIRILILISFGLCRSFAQDAAQPQPSLKWKNVSIQYERLSEIKPVLLNQGTQAVFLSRIYPDGSAQLERFNEATGEWETGAWGIRCGTVSYAVIPIEIPPQQKRRIQVYWQLSTDDWKKPKHFVVLHSAEKRPLPGRYRFVLRYSLKPWTLVNHPDAVYYILSPEFILGR